MECPKCHAKQEDGRDDCIKCGIVFGKYIQQVAQNVGPVRAKRSIKVPLAVGAGIGLLALVAFVGFAGGSRSGHVDAPVQAVRPLSEPAKAAFLQGQAELNRGNYETASRLFSSAIAAQGEFLEAFYSRGVARTALAVERIRDGKEKPAAKLFREAVADKKKALELMRRGSWLVFLSDKEQADARQAVKRSLDGIDTTLGDEQSLLTALRVMAGPH